MLHMESEQLVAVGIVELLAIAAPSNIADEVITRKLSLVVDVAGFRILAAGSFVLDGPLVDSGFASGSGSGGDDAREGGDEEGAELHVGKLSLIETNDALCNECGGKERVDDSGCFLQTRRG
jgi:hypothetical protein